MSTPKGQGEKCASISRRSKNPGRLCRLTWSEAECHTGFLCSFPYRIPAQSPRTDNTPQSLAPHRVRASTLRYHHEYVAYSGSDKARRSAIRGICRHEFHSKSV